MSREIKFRGWHRELKVMVYSNELVGGIEYACNPVRALNVILNEDDLGFDFMQYTGLKDKNGKEIYEGDIIHDHKYDAGLGKVYWSQEYGGWSVHFFTQYTEQLREWLVDYNEGAEIIGNIYENPELLEVKR